MRTLTVDLGGLSDCCTDQALEVLHKSLADPPDSDAIWQPHPEQLIRRSVEAVSGVGARLLQRVLAAVLDFVRKLDGAHKAAGFAPDAAEVEAAVRRLAGRQPRDYTLEDWMALVDWLVAHYLPEGVIKSQAEYIAVRGAIAGKLRAHAPGGEPVEGYDDKLPASMVAAMREADFNPVQEALLDIAHTRAAEAITFVGEQTRHRMKRILIDHMERRAFGDKSATGARLEQSLSDEFAILNRDWRRIAITEIGNVQNEALIATLAPGTRVRRFEAYEGACPFCRKINGMEFTVVSPDKPHKDGWGEVWNGKTNVGRSASPRKRMGDNLVAREEDEMWWPAAGLQHPNCRGGWTVIANSDPAVDPKTRKFVEGLMQKHGLTELA